MAQVRIALLAQRFGALHEMAVVVLRRDVIRRRGLPEARPARARFELVLRAEKLGAAAAAAIDALLVVVPVLPREGAFGAFPARDLEFFGRQLLAPLGIAFR